MLGDVYLELMSRQKLNRESGNGLWSEFNIENHRVVAGGIILPRGCHSKFLLKVDHEVLFLHFWDERSSDNVSID